MRKTDERTYGGSDPDASSPAQKSDTSGAQQSLREASRHAPTQSNDKSAEKRGDPDASASGSDTEKENGTVPAAVSSSTTNGDMAKVTVYRRLTFKRGADFDSVQGSVEFSAPRSHVFRAVKEGLEALRSELEQEKRDTIAKARLASTEETVVPAPLQSAQNAPSPKPEPADPYSRSLPWCQSKNHLNLKTIRVTDKLSPLAKELYEKLRREGGRRLKTSEATYKISTTTYGTEFLQRWSNPSVPTT